MPSLNFNNNQSETDYILNDLDYIYGETHELESQSAADRYHAARHEAYLNQDFDYICGDWRPYNGSF